jgi:transposase
MAQKILKQNLKQVLKQSIGLDVSKDTVAACFSQSEIGNPFRILSSRTFSISEAGFKQLNEWIMRQKDPTADLHLLMEATGVYYEDLAYFLQGKSYRVSVLLPNKTSAYAKSLDYKTKTDKIDAKKLAQMSLERELMQWTPPNEDMLKIKRLCRGRANQGN